LILNSTGQIFFEYANEIIDRINDIENILSLTPSEFKGEIKIGSSTTIGNYVLPELIGKFNKKYPNIKITLLIDNTEKIIQMISDFKIDIGYIEGICGDKNINVEEWRDDELVIFTNCKNKILKNKISNIQSLLNADWILREKGSGTRKIFENAIKDNFQNLFIKFEFGNTESIKNAILNNLGISCLSKITIKNELKRKLFKIIKISDLNLERKFFRIIHKEKYLTKKLNLLLTNLV
jgi:DNA-binding transcriptional LysR family regulator